MGTLLVVLFTFVAFMGMILLLALKPKFAAQLTRIIFVIVAITGLLFYGYGFMYSTGNFLLAVVRALLAVLSMYAGGTDWGSLSSIPFMQQTWVEILYWVVHLLAIYTTASAAVITVGAEALRKLRLWLARWGDLNLIYGVSNETIALGKQLLQQKKGAVVFIDNKPDAAKAAAIARDGCVLRSDDNAMCANLRFLKTIGANNKKRRITLYAMEGSASNNLQYARALLETMRDIQIQPEKTALVIRARESESVKTLQVLGDAYGYGSVTAVQETGLAARTLIRQYPPCDHICFDEKGLATEDFEALIIGFGQVGQAVLRQLVMNGQFEGSTFRAAVFAPDCDSVKGYFANSYPQVLENYDIRFFACDARSEQIYAYLKERVSKIKYLVVCTGSEQLNNELAEDVTEFLLSRGVCLSAYLCGHQGVKKFSPADRTTKYHSLYRSEALSMETMDALAMLVNSQYQHDDGRTPLQHWLCCDYFSRMSCRATADFLPAMLKMAGKTREQILESGWELTPEQKENLSRTEHLRWCAFHYCMGFAPMTEEEYQARTREYCRQIAAGEKPLRIGKNMVNRTHACLISWEELDGLSAAETCITGKAVDYKAMDTENVMLIPELLRKDK